jgi:hypothetical protein
MVLNYGTPALYAGKKIARENWNGKGIFVAAQIPDENSKMSSPYLYIDTTGLQSDNADAPRSCVPWAPSQTDMFACDWVVVE